ncbi:MAG: hypothetical protein ACK559_22230 [bacterium]
MVCAIDYTACRSSGRAPDLAVRLWAAALSLTSCRECFFSPLGEWPHAEGLLDPGSTDVLHWCRLSPRFSVCLPALLALVCILGWVAVAAGGLATPGLTTLWDVWAGGRRGSLLCF